MSNFVVGEYYLDSFVLNNGAKQEDIKALISSWSIQEDINDGFIKGSVKIIDTNNLVQSFPIQGEEKIEVEYTDYFQNTMFNEFFVYSVQHSEMVFQNSDQIQTYELFFCSINRFLSSTQTVFEGFEGLVSEAAETLYNKYIADIDQLSQQPKELLVEPTDFQTRLVVPGYSPIQAMHFLTRNSTSGDSSSMYRFFENREKVYFASPEFVVQDSAESGDVVNYGEGSGKEQRTFSVFSPDDYAGENKEKEMYSVLGLKYLNRVNTIDDMDKGLYRRTVIEIDVMTRELTKQDILFPQDMTQYVPEVPLHPAHGQKFVDSMMPEPMQIWTLKDWTDTSGTLRPNPNNSTLFGKKSMQLEHEYRNAIEIVVYGRNSIFAGTLIWLDIPTFKNRSAEGTFEQDEERSGFYFVIACNNEFSGDTYRQVLRITRMGEQVDLSSSDWPTIERITPTEAIGSIPVYGAGAEVLTETANSELTPVSSLPAVGGYENIAPSESVQQLKEDPAFQAEMNAVLERYPQLSEEEIYQIVEGESGGDSTAVAPNKKYAGLFQLGSAAADGLSPSEIAKLSPAEQMNLYGNYLDDINYKGGGLGMYQAAPGVVANYAAKNGSVPPDNVVLYIPSTWTKEQVADLQKAGYDTSQASRSFGEKVLSQNSAGGANEITPGTGWLDDNGVITAGSVNKYYSKKG